MCPEGCSKLSATNHRKLAYVRKVGSLAEERVREERCLSLSGLWRVRAYSHITPTKSSQTDFICESGPFLNQDNRDVVLSLGMECCVLIGQQRSYTLIGPRGSHVFIGQKRGFLIGHKDAVF